MEIFANGNISVDLNLSAKAKEDDKWKKGDPKWTVETNGGGSWGDDDDGNDTGPSVTYNATKCGTYVSGTYSTPFGPCNGW